MFFFEKKNQKTFVCWSGRERYVSIRNWLEVQTNGHCWRLLLTFCCTWIGAGGLDVTASAAQPQLVHPVNNQALQSMLASLRVVGDVHTDGGFGVRVFQAEENPNAECDPGNEINTCPREFALILVGQYLEGLVPRSFWRTDPMIGLEVKSVSEAPGYGYDWGSVEIALSACTDPSGEGGTAAQSSKAKHEWYKTRIKLNVTYEGGVKTDLFSRSTEQCALY
jgi:hypothetical protein